MSVNKSAQYTKVGAVFASADEAYADKNSLYGPVLSAEVDECYANMLTDGVLLEPVSYTWDQATHILSIVKIVSSAEEYQNAITFDVAAATQLSIDAGWTLVG